MAISAVEEGVQTELQVESREEKLTRLFDMEMNIQERKGEREVHTNAANALKNAIKNLEKEKVDLLNNLNSGQETVIPVAVSAETEESDDEGYPSEEELEEFQGEEESDSSEEELDGSESEAADEETA